MKTLTEAATFDATIKVPEDNIDLVEQSTIEPDLGQKLANRTLYLKEALEPSSPPSRTVYIPATAFDWQGSTVTIANDQSVTVATNSGRGVFAVANILPSGATVTACEVLAKPGFARAGIDAVQIEWTQIIHTWSTPAVGTPSTATGYDDGTTALQVFGIGGSVSIQASDRRQNSIALQAGNDAATGGRNDVFHGVRITFTDPGPRNYG